MDTTDDIRITLMNTQGQMDLYINLGGSVNGRKPTNESHEFTSKYMKGGNFKNSKAILLPIALL